MRNQHLVQDSGGGLIRDPIHGDVPVGPLQIALIDTPLFQRLRYIRQNGLLHFVFPGAVHSRFTHSIGTMYIAGRVFKSLFDGYEPGSISSSDGSEPLTYIGQVFETAALLHDVGHVAFSHSIENLDDENSFFRPFSYYAFRWDEGNGILEDWFQQYSEVVEGADQPIHETIGLFLVRVLFGGRYSSVEELCKKLFSVAPETFAQDVQAILLPDLEPSEYFVEYAASLTETVDSDGEIDSGKRAIQLQKALSTLISGTVDVDRMDYLRRDSLHTGTVYGEYDPSVIANAFELCIGEAGGVRLHVGIRSRAVRAVDDFLWSRYQLFTQVLNHKTNVMLNALLTEALPEAASGWVVEFGSEIRTLSDLIEFTDDAVMSRVVRASLRQEGAQDLIYHRALVGRELPLYLGREEITDLDEKQKAGAKDKYIDDYKQKASDGGYDPATIRTWTTESALIKGGGFPLIIHYDKATSTNSILPPTHDEGYQVLKWGQNEKLPTKIQHVHFFVDRHKPGAA